MDKLKLLFPYFRPYRGQLVIGVISILVTATISLMAPLVIGRAIDSLRGDVTPETLLGYGLLLVGISASRGVFQFLQRLILVRMSRAIEYDLRNEFFSHLERLDAGFYQRHYTGDLMARATNDLAAVRMLCGPAIMYGSNTVFAGTGALLFMIGIHPGMTLVALCVLPAVAVVTRVFGRRIHVLFERVQESFSDLSTRVQENLSGARVVRAYVQEDQEERAFDRLNLDYVERSRHLILWSAAFNPVLQSIVGFGLVIILWYGGRLLIADEITVGEFVSFNLFLGLMTWPMIAIGWVINLTERGTASLIRIRAILDQEPAIRDREPLVEVPSLRGAIRFNDLDFAYDDGPPVLRDVDVEIEAGEAVAIVGRTGSGKSTLLALIPRLVEPPAGALLIDDVDVRHLPLATLRGAIAMVPQESFLFSASIRDNIAYGRPDASDETVARYAALAGLESDLEGFPDGLDTMVGERGITLSGGQKQRVALARALVREPEILLLDDCLSAVDTRTEERILRNLRTVFPGRTVLLVSHRISAAQLADQVLVLDHGRIAERGSHHQLLAQGGLYAELNQRQMLEDQLLAV